MKINSAEILCVGTEILIGDIVNTNAAFISGRLALLGINQYHQSAVGDNSHRLAECISSALERCDLLIMTGGLGPTYDDLTKETAAECMGKKLVMHQPSLDRLKSYFEKKNKEMSPANLKQAMMPEGAVVFQNNNGTAPGLAIEDFERGKVIIMLPGPPRELKPMFLESVEPYLAQFSDSVMVSKNVNIYGIGESDVDYLISDIMKNSQNPTVAPYCLEGEVRLRVTARGERFDECEKMCDDMIETLKKSAIGGGIYGVDSSLEATVISLLRAQGKTVAIAESCTGGLVSKRLTDVPGASAVFAGGVVSYFEDVKKSLLGVSERTLEKYSAVSGKTACEMAAGALRVVEGDIAVSITGYAGPAAKADEPVGLVYIGIATKDRYYAKEYNFAGTREHIRMLASNAALYAIIAELGK